MANNKFSNIHAHIFTVQHAPDYFLQTVIKNRTAAKWILDILMARGSVVAVKRLLELKTMFKSDKRQLWERYLEFIKIGTSNSQEDIFNNINADYLKYGNHQIVVLTQVLDYLDVSASSNHIKIQTQVEQIAQLKKNAAYTNVIRPFLGVDPRMPIDLLKSWAEKYISLENGFCGLKIYPAYGFFPFDKRFDKLWQWAEDNQIPVMTHTTRGGTWYLGSFNSLVNAGGLTIQPLDLSELNDPFKFKANTALTNIKARIDKVIADKNVQKNNHQWCNIFGHPQNFIPVLEKYPNLKICFAHFGGSEEVIANTKDDTNSLQKGCPEYLGDNWTSLILELIKTYNNVYTDISYTLSDGSAMEIIENYITTNKISRDKILFGTDFFLTQQEEKGTEIDLQANFYKYLDPYTNDIAYINPEKYLANKIVNF